MSGPGGFMHMKYEETILMAAIIVNYALMNTLAFLSNSFPVAYDNITEKETQNLSLL